MIKKLRLILFKECNRSCEGCCNNDYDLDALSTLVVTSNNFKQYDSIFLTGGEPMLHPEIVLYVTRLIKEQTDAPIYMYTAKSKRALDLIAMLNVLDGITLTLHEQYDVEPFNKLNNLLRMMKLNKSLRLNVFKGVNITGIDTSLWNVKDNIEWIKDCPLPKGEELQKWWV